MLKRYKIFIAWYTKLRTHGMNKGLLKTGPWYVRYNKFNCFRWAWFNSKYYNTDGTYRNE